MFVFVTNYNLGNKKKASNADFYGRMLFILPYIWLMDYFASIKAKNLSMFGINIILVLRFLERFALESFSTKGW